MLRLPNKKGQAIKTDISTRLLVLILLCLAMVVWLDGIRTNFIPCSTNCGETFDAIQFVDNYRLYGTRFGLMQDMATASEPESRPFLYTHNVNLGGLIFTAAEVLGVSTLAGKQLITLAAFLGGIAYIYLTILLFTRSTFVALVAISMLAIDYVHVASYGLNALRAWHWIALFGSLFHAARLCDFRESAFKVPHWIALLVMAMVSFGIGYDFFAIVFFSTVTAYLILDAQPVLRGRVVRTIAVVACFCLPFFARQVHVMSVLGVEYWWRDFSYSILIKVPGVAFIAAPISLADVDAFYASWNVLRPPAAPAQSISEILNTLGSMVVHVTIPEFGLIGVVTLAITLAAGFFHTFWNILGIRRLCVPLLAFAAVSILAAFTQPTFQEIFRVGGVAAAWFSAALLFPALLALAAHPRFPTTGLSPTLAVVWSVLVIGWSLMPAFMHRSPVPELFGRYSPKYFGGMIVLGAIALFAVWVGHWITLRLQRIDVPPRPSKTHTCAADLPFDMAGASSLMAILGVGIILGLAVFAPFSLHVYLKHQFPLIVVPMYLAKALLLTFCLWLGVHVLQRRHRLILRLLAGFLVVDFVVVNAATLHALQPLSTDWSDEVKLRAQSTFAVSWIPNSVSVMTDNWVVGVRPDMASTFIDRLLVGNQLFKENELFLFGERDAPTRIKEYLSPDYWLYFRTDQTSPFDLKEPSCRRDWISSGLVWLFDWHKPDLGSAAQTWVFPGEVAPGMQSITGGRLTVDYSRVDRLELVGPRVMQGVGPDLDALYKTVETGFSPRRLTFNCITSSFSGPLEVAPDATEGFHIYAFHLVSTSGARTVIGGMVLDVHNVDQRLQSPSIPQSMRQPTIAEILQSFDRLPIAAWGKNYVLFDLRKPLNAIP